MFHRCQLRILTISQHYQASRLDILDHRLDLHGPDQHAISQRASSLDQDLTTEHTHQVVPPQGETVHRLQVEATKKQFGEVLSRQDAAHLVLCVHYRQREPAVFLQEAPGLQERLVE